MNVSHRLPYSERYSAYRRYREQGLTIGQAAQELGVHRRTAERYEQALWRSRGVLSRRRHEDAWLRPHILDHLRAHPGALLSAWELARVLAGDTNVHSSARRAVARLVADGLVELVVQPMNSSDCRPVRRYRLAVQEARAA